MNLEFLPKKITDALEKINTDELVEIRIRKGFPIICSFCYGRIYLVDKQSKQNIIVDKNDIDYIISEITERSYYAYNDRIKKGYLTYRDGTRIGITGKCVYDREEIISIKDISSLNIRFCKNRENCSKEVYEKIIYNGQVLNTLLISPPTKGKTTILKDLALKINELNKYSILIIDERGEFSSIIGENIDTITNCTKLYGFTIGIRSMAPDIVITDEISSIEDWKYLTYANSSGVRILASCHGESIECVKNKEGFNRNIFSRYVILESADRPGVIREVLNGEFLRL